MIRTGKYTGSVQSSIGLIEYTVSCTADYSYDPGCYRTKNGDGWPPSEDFDDLTLKDFEEYNVYDADGNVISDDTFYDVNRDTIEQVINNDFENVDPWDCDWDEPECYDDYEPEDN